MTPINALYVAGRGGRSDPVGGLFRYDRADRGWTGAKLTAVPQLSSLARHPDLTTLYGTSGVGADGRLHVWRLDGRDVTALAAVDSGGAEPCHVCVHPSGRLLIVVNYTSGSLAAWELDQAGLPVGEPRLTVLAGAGSGAEPSRQGAPHPHQATVSGGRLLVPDLGSDLIRVFEIDEAEIGPELESRRVPAGTGPRHVGMATDGTVAVSGELAQSVVFPFLDDCPAVPSTSLTSLARSRPPRNYPGDLQISGRLGYVANRGHDTIGVFTIGDRPELIAEVESGVRWPQHLLLAGDELFIAGWDSSLVVSLPLGTDGVPGAPQASFSCPGAAWLVAIPG